MPSPGYYRIEDCEPSYHRASDFNSANLLDNLFKPLATPDRDLRGIAICQAGKMETKVVKVVAWKLQRYFGGWQDDFENSDL